jgi:hypothetical protein
VNTLRAQLIFPSKLNFCNLFKFSATKGTKNQYLPHLSFETNFIKSESLRAFQQHEEHLQIPIKFSILILFSFHWKNGSIINNFHTIVPKSLKLSWCTPTHWELSKDTKSMALLGDLKVTKQNKVRYTKWPYHLCNIKNRYCMVIWS